MNPIFKKVAPVLRRLETDLAKFYGFKRIGSVLDFLIDNPTLSTLDDIKEKRFHNRASIYLIQEENEIFFGVYFSESVLNSISQHNPLSKLSSQNLDAFCVLVEEISHFHLLLNRAIQNRKVNQIELEWQAEIDKVLFSSFLLKEQVGSFHILAMANLIYKYFHIAGANKERYEEANKYAECFWSYFNFLAQHADDPNQFASLKNLLRDLYIQSWPEKLRIIEGSYKSVLSSA